jgi:hypothetical protein
VLPLLKYTVLRLGLFVLALVTLRVLGAGVLLAVVLAALASMLASYVLLRGPREELTAVIEQRVAGRLRRRGQDDAAEDAAADSARSAQQSAQRQPDAEQ